ncbi:NAD(P)-dependent oxidoreductase [Streptomyces alanosinicus]|uniref:3-beta hydroxysteroid dehydrogenase n=1 Tax=Streptomyces alanosinicus TaxID=68171 RepID=A0A918YQR9_9ACTN|nr:NAD(P)H-binding protein [Streptomyces alanosinicus]GHE10275.1 3-beta hydroxysteroid dehydrogenase [Streptomyces alanosinicus]
MKILLFGASGNIGSAITHELITRGHAVTGVTRTGNTTTNGTYTAKAGDVRNAATIAALAEGHDAVVSAIGPRHDGSDDDHDIIVGATTALITGLRQTTVKRLVVLGGAGSLETAPGVKVIDSPHFPAMWKANALAQSEALELYRQVFDLDWTFVSPPKLIEPGTRTGHYRRGGDQLLTDENGDSRISIADFAIGFADEIETPRALRARISLAY